MKLEELIYQSQKICESQDGCSCCPLNEFTCIDKRGNIDNCASSRQTAVEGLLKLRDYIESLRG